MFVKICGLSERVHVFDAIEAGADAIGLVLTASPRFVTPEMAKDLVAAAEERVLTVGVFRDEPVAEIERLAAASGVAAVQVHGHRSRAEIAKLTGIGRKLIRAVSFDDETLEENFGENMLLVDAPKPGSGESWDYAAMSELELADVRGRWLLAGGLTPDTVAGAIAAASPWGVDVSSGIETAPGQKSSELIRRFVHAARSASE
ncbi:phosphoribosylanthranilate isomerase [Salinibacterium sp. SYSU T00001]|uniref:phosphoribosylanthranilate isomerase n=1 Tax=Homoserinimonas sedimenticola TaxID=2986805 RepID=UPI0022367240|nr:phosphoribosylanthranilate isomerase [Salinibacterium sedimenticola]MCW4386085.1 phosphoribosylanthranilate isomerase [Salinibacterium sedimenticola]